MLSIKVRKAEKPERLHITEDYTPNDVRLFDGTDPWASIFSGLDPGDWVVEIQDPDHILRCQASGIFFVQMEDDAGYCRVADGHRPALFS